MAGSDGRLFRAWLPECDVEKTVEAIKAAESLLKACHAAHVEL